jgi:predicted restriction endonuclease
MIVMEKLIMKIISSKFNSQENLCSFFKNVLKLKLESCIKKIMHKAIMHKGNYNLGNK